LPVATFSQHLNRRKSCTYSSPPNAGNQDGCIQSGHRKSDERTNDTYQRSGGNEKHGLSLHGVILVINRMLTLHY
jgi:hypothetical protein